MPRLLVFTKEYSFSSDDMVIPTAVEAMATGSWMALFGYLYSTHSHLFAVASCPEASCLHAYSLTGFCISSLNLVLLVVIMRNCLRGTVINTWPRRTVGRWIAIKTVLSVATGISLIITSKKTLWDHIDCDDTVLWWFRAGVRLFWVPTLIGFHSIYDLVHGARAIIRKEHKDLDSLSHDTTVVTSLKKSWGNRFHYIVRFLGFEKDPAFIRLGKVFTELFIDNPEVVVSDVISSLILISQKQGTRLQQLRSDTSLLREELMNPERSHCKPKPWMTVSRAAHYMKFALATYGWTHYIYTSRMAIHGFLKVLCRSRYFPRKLPVNICDDNSFLGYTTAICMVAGLPYENFVHISFHNQLYELPYYVVLDHEQKSIIVAIRGTLSLHDIVTDFLMFGETLALPDLPTAQAHEGMLTSAKFLCDKLVRGEDPLLEKAQTQLQGTVGEQEAKKYDLVVTGHSLGAGVAAILTLLLRHEKGYEHVKCFAFSPPGGLVSLYKCELTSVEAARYAEDFIMSVAVEDDIVPRLGLTHLYKLKIQTLETLRDLDIPKHQVFRKPFEQLFARLLRPCEHRKKECSWQGNPEATKIVEYFQTGIDKAKQNIEKELSEHAQLYLPGCVLYLHGLRKKGDLSGYFTRGDAKTFQDIVLCSSMVSHHLPIVVLNSLNKLSQQEASIAEVVK